MTEAQREGIHSFDEHIGVDDSTECGGTRA